MKNIPTQVTKAAAELIEAYGDSIAYIGEYDGHDVYVYEFPKDSSTGYPFVYLFKDGVATEISEDIALHIINSTVKNSGI